MKSCKFGVLRPTAKMNNTYSHKGRGPSMDPACRNSFTAENLGHLDNKANNGAKSLQYMYIGATDEGDDADPAIPFAGLGVGQ
jgi:hypothetical protein